MVCTSIYGVDDWYWHGLFAFWVHGNRSPSLRHDLHVRMHAFQATQHPTDGLSLGTFSRSAQDRNDALWCVPLSTELMIAAGMFHLPCGCIAVDWQA